MFKACIQAQNILFERQPLPKQTMHMPKNPPIIVTKMKNPKDITKGKTNKQSKPLKTSPTTIKQLLLIINIIIKLGIACAYSMVLSQNQAL